VIELSMGMGLTTAVSLHAATKQALREHGTRHVKQVRAATHDDVVHVTAMGGWVPEGFRLKKESIKWA
jgi:hypothetical protein